MNELTREAALSGDIPLIRRIHKQRKSHRGPQKPAKGHPRDYITGLEPPAGLLKVDLDQFREEAIDNE